MTLRKPLNKFLDLFNTNIDQDNIKDTSSLGAQAEALAEKLLIKQGLKLISQNYTCKLGEIDRIMLDNDTLVFIEVRLRHNQLIHASESVNIHKQRKIIKASQHFLQVHSNYTNYPCRFDVVAFSGLHENKSDWIKDAFQLQL